MAQDNPTNAYLAQLKPDSQFGNTFIGRYLTNIRLVTLIILSILILGLFSIFTLPRRLNPEVKIPLIIISTVLPGASPNDIESLITIPIEDELESIANVTAISSSSNNNVSVITVEFESNIDPATARNRVQTAVDNVSDLPTDSLDSDITELDFENQPVWTFALTTSNDVGSLMRFAHKLQVDLEASPLIKNVQISGLDEQEVQISIDPLKVTQLNLSPLSLSSAISTALASFPAGQVQSTYNSFSVTIDPQVQNLEQLRQLPLIINNQTLLLQDIAIVSLQSQPNQAPAYLTQESVTRQSVTMSVFKNSAADITQAQNAANQIITDSVADASRFQVIDILNTSAEIEQQFQELSSNFVSTIILVFVTMLVFLGLRQAVVASVSIPLTFLIAFTVMQFVGISLNFLSLFSLLLALGLVVDDAIVIISAMTAYYKTGRFTASETGFLVWKDFIVPIWSTTITTVWAFIPLLLASGIIGEFIKSIPIVVSATLLSSTAVAVLINLPLMIVLLQPQVPKRVKIAATVILLLILLAIAYLLLPQSPFTFISLSILLLLALSLLKFHRTIKASLSRTAAYKKISQVNTTYAISQKFSLGFISTSKLEAKYQRSIKAILSTSSKRRRTILMVVIFSLFSYLLVALGLVQNEFFPKTDSDVIYLEAKAPSGTNTQSLVRESQQISQLFLFHQAEIEYFTTQIGAQADAQNVGQANNHTILFTLNLQPEAVRSLNSVELANQLRQETATYSGISTLNVVEQSGGPPVGADIEIKLIGPEVSVLTTTANQIQAYLKTVEGVDNINISIQPGISKLSFQPDFAKLVENQISLDQVGLALRTVVSGFTYDELTLEGTVYEISYRSLQDEVDLETLNQLTLPSPQGPISLSSLGSFTLQPNPSTITREDGQRTISITAAVIGDTPAPVINQDLETFADTQLNLPPGYSWKTGGANEENQQSVQSILQAMLIAALLILITMVVQLQSFRKAMIVLLVIPLAASGVFVIFALTSTPLSFPALIGVLALFGIVVNNSIMIVEKINQNIAFGLKLKDSIVDASTSRLEPILLSSLTTIMGLLPITISDPLWRGLGGAIIAGLSVSGIIMLFFIPTVYFVIYKNEIK